MNQLLDRLFGLRSLTFGGEDVEFRFAREMPLWAWVGVLAACVLLALWSYWRLLGNRTARITLALLRAAVLALIALLIAGPELVKQNERVERDWVVVMADRSGSMTVADAGGDSGRPLTREAQLRDTMQMGGEIFQRLSENRQLLFMGFDAGAYELRSTSEEGGSPGLVDLGLPNGRRTFIGQSLEQALRRVAARPVAGIVILSDGRSADIPGRSVLRQLESARVPIFAVPLGSTSAIPDLAVTRVDSSGAAFVGDMVPVGVHIERFGAEDGAAPLSGTVQLIDTATGLILDERPLRTAATDDERSGEARRVTLLARPAQAGAASWSVRLISDGPDLSADNNTAPVRIEIADRPIRVIYFDGYPRWEYRYVKNILVREPSVRVSSLLLASDRRYIQDGNEHLDAIPRSQQGWNPFDVIVMGDLRPELFSSEQLAQIRRHIAERGAGLLWIGGAGSTPGAWRGTPLADLLPFALKPEAAGDRGPLPWLNPVLIKPGTAAERYGVLQLTGQPEEPWPRDLMDPALGWPLVRWAQRIEAATLKPTTEVLAYAHPAEVPSQTAAPEPLVMTMRYGAGRTVYVGTDETWRYRYAAGEVLTERFWIPLVRLLARESLGRSGKPAILTASPETVRTNQTVQIGVRLLDQVLIDQRPSSITVRVANAGLPAELAKPAEVTLMPQGTSDDQPAAAFGGVWLSAEPGVFTVTSIDPVLAGIDLSARVEVILPDDEMRFPQTDHGLLTTLAQQSGGAVLQPDRLNELPALLPNRQLRVLGMPDIETLWDKPFVWIVLLSLLSLEWIGRRFIKLA